MIKQISERVWKFYFDNLGSNCYLVKADGRNILIDTSGEENMGKLVADLQKTEIRPEKIDVILLTHIHYDHIGNLGLFKNARIYASGREIEDFKKQPFGAVLNENFIEKVVEGKGVTKPTYEFARLGKVKIEPIEKFKIKLIEVIETPGHTRGSIALYLASEKILFSGDTLFEEGIGRTDLPTSQPEKITGSLQRLKRLKYKILCPGH